MKHQILFDAEVDIPQEIPHLLEQVIAAALDAQGVALSCEISVLLTDDAGIRQINQDMRQIDRSTDVLSFPMFQLKAGHPPQGKMYLDPATGLCPLGDIALSLERSVAQAEQFGHSVKRELAYLTIHSVLHLLGYDHMDEGAMKAQMREREEMILHSLGMGTSGDSAK